MILEKQRVNFSGCIDSGDATFESVAHCFIEKAEPVLVHCRKDVVIFKRLEYLADLRRRAFVGEVKTEVSAP